MSNICNSFKFKKKFNFGEEQKLNQIKFNSIIGSVKEKNFNRSFKILNKNKQNIG